MRDRTRNLEPGIRLFRALLRCFPASFRDEFEREMIDVFRHEHSAARGAGTERVAALWWRTARDMMATGIRQHLVDFARDVRLAFRGLQRAPAFTAGAILTLALGMAPAAAMFSVLDAIVFRPLPYPGADRLMAMWGTTPDGTGRELPMSLPNVMDIAAAQRSFERIGAYTASSFVLTGDLTNAAEPERVRGAILMAGALSALGVSPVMGRLFTEADSRVGADAVVLLSHSLWQRRFGGRADIVGADVRIDGAPATVIGVMPDGFAFPSPRATLWMPIVNNPHMFPRGSNFALAVGRLRPGAVRAQAEAELKAIAGRIAGANSETAARFRVYLESLQDDVVGDTPRILYVVSGGLAFVLLIACANVAALFIVRTSGRSRELALRLTLGANRLRLVRQLLAESLVIVAIGGACALALAHWLLATVQRAEALNLPRLAGARTDGRVLLFLFVVIAGVAVVLTIGSAVRLAEPSLARAIAGAGRTAGSSRATRLRGVLVVSQFAFALVLVAGAGLLLRSTARLLAVDPGFDTEQALTFRVVLPAARYPQAEHRQAFYTEVTARMREIAGVAIAASAAYVPMTEMRTSRRFAVIGRPLPRPGEEPYATDPPVGPDYFRAMGIGVVQGRTFTDHDRADTPLVVVVNETFARQMFPGTSALGQQIRFYAGRPDAPPPPPREIVGIVGDVRQKSLIQDAEMQLYVPQAQSPWSFGAFILRATQGRDAAALSGAAKQVLASVDPELAPFDMRTLDDLVDTGSARHRTLAALLAALALVALALAAVGIYGVMSTDVRSRTQEIAVRVALGATRGRVFGGILAGGMRLAAIGAVLGLAGAFVVTRVMRTLLFEVEPIDPLVFTAGAVVLLAVAAAACAWPARRALRLNPAVALRGE